MIFKYLNVGILNTLIGFLVIFFCLNILKINYHLSYFIGYAVGLIISFSLNKRYTFNNNSKWHHLLLPFIIIFLFSYLTSHLILMVLVEKFYFNMNISVIISMFVYTVLSYLLNRKLFLKNPGQKNYK
jgi:putative flippase GtrA